MNGAQWSALGYLSKLVKHLADVSDADRQAAGEMIAQQQQQGAGLPEIDLAHELIARLPFEPRVLAWLRNAVDAAALLCDPRAQRVRELIKATVWQRLKSWLMAR